MTDDKKLREKFEREAEEHGTTLDEVFHSRNEDYEYVSEDGMLQIPVGNEEESAYLQEKKRIGFDISKLLRKKKK